MQRLAELRREKAKSPRKGAARGLRLGDLHHVLRDWRGAEPRPVGGRGAVVVRDLVPVLHGQVIDRARRRRLRRHDPRPLGARLAARAALLLEELHELLARRVMVEDRRPDLLERVQHGLVELGQHAVLPERARGVDAHRLRGGTELVVARFVGKVARGDLARHVEAVERRAGVLDAADREDHRAHRGNRVPAQSERGDRGMRGVLDRRLLDDALGVLEEMALPACIADLERQDVEAPTRRGRRPAERDRAARGLDVRGVAGHRAVGLEVARVLDQLPALDVRGQPIAAHGGEDGDRRADPARTARLHEMLGAARRDLGGFGHLAAIDHDERLPEQPSDAARVVAPREARAEREFVRGVVVVVRARERRAHRAQARLAGRRGEAVLVVILANEGLGLRELGGRREHAQSLAQGLGAGGCLGRAIGCGGLGVHGCLLRESVRSMRAGGRRGAFGKWSARRGARRAQGVRREVRRGFRRGFQRGVRARRRAS